MSTVTITLILLGVAAAFFVVILRRMSAPVAIQECGGEWLESFSVDKYRPMLRLLAEDDYEFLAAQPGYEAAIARKLRSERRKIFRAYLRNLIRDFHRLQLLGRMMVVYSETDRSDFAKMLFQHKMVFFRAVLMVELRLLSHAVGIGTVDVRNLLGSLEGVHAQVAGASA